MKDEIVFDPEKHEYWLGNEEIPGVSKILQKLGLVKSYEGVDPFYAQRGSAVHKCIELDLAGTLDEESVAEELKPFLAAWRKFVKETGFKTLGCEQVVYSPTERFCTTYDHLGLLNNQLTVIDTKCTKSHDKGADYQVCGQAYALMDNGQVVQGQGILELHDDGTYDYYAYEVDLTIWESVMKLYRRRIQRKPKK